MKNREKEKHNKAEKTLGGENADIAKVQMYMGPKTHLKVGSWSGPWS